MPTKKIYIDQNKAKIKKLKDLRNFNLRMLDKTTDIKKRKLKSRFDKSIKEKELIIKNLQMKKSKKFRR